MSIDWQNGKNTRALREALLAVYTKRTRLAIFISDEFSQSLNSISNEGNLTDDVFNLIEHFKSGGEIPEFYDKFCSENKTNPAIDTLKREVKDLNFTPTKATQISEDDWQQLRGICTQQYLPEMSRAFLTAFEFVLGRSFQKLYPETNPYDLDTIYQALERLDDPKLTVSFAQETIARMKQDKNAEAASIENLTQWRDLLLNEHNLTPAEIQPPDSSIRQGYLLVSLEANPKRTQKDGVYVNVYAELHVVGQETPEPFGGTSTTCPLTQVAEHLCGLIQKAEQTIENTVTLELFLPNVHLEHDVASWLLVHKGQEVGILGRHQAYVVRSFDRAKNKVSQTRIKTKWQALLACVEACTPCKQFHTQDTCPEWGDLVGNLNNATGLLLTAKLPLNIAQRQRIIADIVKAAVPISLWFAEAEDAPTADWQSEFESLLNNANCITNFSDLAQQWQRHRIQTQNLPARHLKILCDCPHRWPDLPDATNNEEDALVSN